MEKNKKVKTNEHLMRLTHPPYFIGTNPKMSFNDKIVMPSIHPSAYIGPFAVIIGDVTIGENVFIAPHVSIRADEGSPFYIGANSNIQDGVILHGLRDVFIKVAGKNYSIYLGPGVSCAHGCIIHGPCYLGSGAFVGFQAMVFNAVIGDGAFVSPKAVVTNGVVIGPNRFIPLGAVIDQQEKADNLSLKTNAEIQLVGKVQRVNQEFSKAYSQIWSPEK